MTMENISFPLFFLFLSFFSLCYSTTKYAKYIEVNGEVRGSFFSQCKGNVVLNIAMYIANRNINLILSNLPAEKCLNNPFKIINILIMTSSSSLIPKLQNHHFSSRRHTSQKFPFSKHP